jgi:hypothetical protein
MSDLRKAFEGMKQSPKPERVSTQEPKRASAQGPKLVRPLESTAKSRHPDYTPVKVFLRSKTHRAAGRKWEDEDIGDFSDLVELLLEKYLNA